MNIPDNIDIFNQYDAYQERKLSRLPKCWCCEQPIQQERAVRIDGNWYCDSCIADYYVEDISDYFEFEF